MTEATRSFDDTTQLTLDAAYLSGKSEQFALECLASIGAQLFGVPACLVSMLDGRQQWQQAAVGLDGDLALQSAAFCEQVAAGGAPLILEDVRAEKSIANAAETLAPNTRFFAIQPICNGHGQVLGAISLIDFSARTFGEAERGLLLKLAMIAGFTVAARRIGMRQSALVAKLKVARRDCLLDPLLGIWNRGGIAALIERQMTLSREQRCGFSIMMLDIDNFKSINDMHGHPVGDEVLKAITSTLRDSLRLDDELGRFGGEEFLAILPGTPAHNAGRLAQRLNREVAALSVTTARGAVACSVSIGVAEWLQPAETAADLISRADQALFTAKKCGRNRAIVSEPGLASAEVDHT
jgi:diguanylate cyclase (GGDEF)-like protein